MGLGSLALASLLNKDQAAAADRVKRPTFRPPHFASEAKRVIYLFMVGGPSPFELLVHNAKLDELHGKPVSEELIKNERFAFIKGTPNLSASSFRFARHGQSGAEISELWHHLASVSDDVAIVKSMHTDEFNHHPAQLMMHTGVGRLGRPSVGAWVTYGLGSASENLPGYVVLSAGAGASGGTSNWSNGFLPARFQGTALRPQGDRKCTRLNSSHW